MPEQLTDDQLTALFAGLRADTITRVRPPGTDAARQTVRRRRTVAVGALIIVLVVLGGGAVLMPQVFARIEREVQPSAAELAEMGATAYQVVEGAAAARTVVARAVSQDGSSTSAVHPSYLGNLTVFAACVGAGRVILVVRGEGRLTPSGDPDQELTRMLVPCGPEPTPLTIGFVAQGFAQMRIGLAPDDDSAHRSGFAYQVTTDLDTLLEVADPQRDPSTALRAPEGTVRVRADVTPRRPTAVQWLTVADRNSILAACSGAGTVTVELRYSNRTDSPPEGATGRRTTQGVPCSGSPKQYTLDLNGGSDAAVGVVLTYESNGTADGRFAFALVRR